MEDRAKQRRIELIKATRAHASAKRMQKVSSRLRVCRSYRSLAFTARNKTKARLAKAIEAVEIGLSQGGIKQCPAGTK